MTAAPYIHVPIAILSRLAEKVHEQAESVKDTSFPILAAHLEHQEQIYLEAIRQHVEAVHRSNAVSRMERRRWAARCHLNPHLWVSPGCWHRSMCAKGWEGVPGASHSPADRRLPSSRRNRCPRMPRQYSGRLQRNRVGSDSSAATCSPARQNRLLLQLPVALLEERLRSAFGWCDSCPHAADGTRHATESSSNSSRAK